MDKLSKIKVITNIIKDQKVNGLINLCKYQYDLLFKNKKILASPITIQIELTSRCNLKCAMCEHSFAQVPKVDMSLEKFKHILNQFPYLKNITLQGLGEPLLNPELFKMIKEAKRRNIRIGLTTNATLLSGENQNKIIESGLDWMYISLDSVDKDIYEQIRRGANFDVTKENIISFLNTKGNKLPETNFWSLLMKNNIEGIPDVIEFANKFNVNKVVLQNIHNWGYADFKSKIDRMKNDGNSNLDELILKIKKVDKGDVRVELNIETKNKKLVPHPDAGAKTCDWPWRSLYITSEGYITPCCMQGADPKLINFGNIFEKSIKEILNNNSYQEFRENLKKGSRPKICIGCPAYYNQEVIKI